MDGSRWATPAAGVSGGVPVRARRRVRTHQRQVAAKSNEITAFRPLLASLDLTDTVVTFDALLTQLDHARFLVEDKHAHYIALVKDNHPTLHALLKTLPWREIPLMDKSRATAHGRDLISPTT